jgi:hypothetical protein
MPNATTRIAGLLTQVVEAALGYNPTRADGPEHAALGAVYLVTSIALANGPAVASAREIEIPSELGLACIGLLDVARSARQGFTAGAGTQSSL